MSGRLQTNQLVVGLRATEEGSQDHQEGRSHSGQSFSVDKCRLSSGRDKPGCLYEFPAVELIAREFTTMLASSWDRWKWHLFDL